VVQRAIIDSGGLADEGVVSDILDSLTDSDGAPDAAPRVGDDLALKELEARHIEAVLRRCDGNRTRAAKILGIERKTLYRKAERLGIALDPEEDP
jgi:DNA-binding NtrC family response regulator